MVVDIIRTDATMTGLGGEPSFLSMWWAPGTPGGSNADATDCLARFRAMWNTLGSKIATGATITFSPTCVGIQASNGELQGVFTGTTPASVTTSGGSSPLPLQTQGLIRWTTGLIYLKRRVRGRTFVPAPDEGDNTGTIATPSVSYVAQLNAGVTSLMTAGSTASFPAVWARPRPAGPGQFAQITAGAASTTWSVQRTRR